MLTKITLILSAALVAGATLLAQDAKRTEASLIAVLKAESSQKEKADACRELARVGTREAVPALAALLADDKLNHMARYALEPIQDAAVDEALRAALGQLQGRPLAGAIGSIGVRRDAAAVNPLGGLLASPDADVAQAAARALGAIGNAPAAALLREAVGKASDANRLAFCEGLLRCAEALGAAGQGAEATRIYEQLRSLKGAPHQVQTAALRGAILTRGAQGLPLLRESLASADYLMFAGAVRTSFEIPGPEVTAVLAGSLNGLSTDNQVVVIQALGTRGDAAALPALYGAARAGAKPARTAAIRAVGELAQPASATALVDLLADTDRDIAQAAQESLASLRGPIVDEAIMGMLTGDNASLKLVAIDLTSRRRMTTAVPALLKAGKDNDAKVRAAALRRAGELAGTSEIPALTDFLMGAGSGPDLEAAEQALSAVCRRASEPGPIAEKLAGLMAGAAPAQKGALLRLLGTLGGPVALKAVRAAVADSNAEVRASALRALGDWKTADAAPDLLALAKAAANPTDRELCLRSYVDLARNPDLPANQRLSMCREVAALVQSKGEKRLLLSALGSVPSLEAVALIGPYLGDAETKEEASAATATVAEQLLKNKAPAQTAAGLVEPLQKAAQATGNADLAKRIQEALKQAQNRAAKK